MPAWQDTWTSRRAHLVIAEVDGARGLGESCPLPGRAPDPAAALAWANHVAHLDATARARGVALASLLAPSPAARVPLCAVVDTPAAALAAVAAGFRTLKVKVSGKVVGYSVPPRGVGYSVPPRGVGYSVPPRGVGYGVLHRGVGYTVPPRGVGYGVLHGVAAIRAAVGPDIAIRVDANRSFERAEVAALCEELAESGVEFLEEPAYGIGGEAYAVPIALDESLSEDVEVEGRICVVKPMVLGPERTMRVIARAGEVVISHALEGPVGFAACAELALAVGGTRAHGLGPHPGLDAWGVHVPTLGRGELIAVPRHGTGLDVDAVLHAARRLG